MELEEVGKVWFSVQKAYYDSLGHGATHPLWEESDYSSKLSVMRQIATVLDHPEWGPGDFHEYWVKAKRQAGYEFGETYDLVTATHPKMVEYALLPDTEKTGYAIFLALIRAMQEGPK